MARLSPDEERDLLRLARASLKQELCDDCSLDDELAGTPISPALREPRGAFVTLKQLTGTGEQLRGCIGRMTSDGPLYRNVIELICKSALEDPRFSPMTAAELAQTRIEISALTPMRDIAGYQEIEIGRHGVQLTKGAASAVFLPQVAVEQGWDVETLLQRLAEKAGLQKDDWPDARLSVFEGQVFGEPKPED